jgi:hypothetical protein
MAAVLRADPAALLDLVTVGDATGNLRPLVDCHAPAAPSAYAAALRNGGEPPNREAWRHRPELVAMLAGVAEGGRLNANRRYYVAI